MRFRTGDDLVAYSTQDDGGGDEIYLTPEQDRQILLDHAQRQRWDDAPALRDIAMACLQSGYFPEAALICRRIGDLDSDDHAALLHLGVALLHDGQLAQAEAIVLDYLQRCPDCSVGHVNLAKIYFDTGRDPDALAELDRALDLDPDNTHALDLFYLALREQGRTQTALERLEDLARARPDSWGPYRTIAQHWQREDDMDRAIAYYSRAFDRAPTNPELLRALSGYLGQQGRLDELVTLVERAARIGPIPPEATYNLARAYLELGRARQALALVNALRSGATPAWQPLLEQLALDIEEACAQPA